ncbi:MAG TPA: rod shape-determining protein [bacterium]|nr:rod shape-determining protein [bacterium]
MATVRGVLARLTRELGIDLGTANTLVYLRGEGIVVREPSVIAHRTDRRGVLAVGDEAKRMIGRTPAEIVATRPLRHGVIADFEITASMLSYFIRRGLTGRSSRRPRVIVGVPHGVTEVEKRAVLDATLHAGAREAYLIEQPLAAAIGAGAPISDPVGSMIVDIGGGTTEVATIALGGIVTARSIRVAGDEMDEAIIQYVRRAYNLLIGERTAEEIKIAIGSAYPEHEEQTIKARGRDLVSGLPRTLVLTSGEIRDAIAQPVQTILETVRTTLERTPPELAADIMERGVLLTGGGSLLRGLATLLADHLEIPVRPTRDPLSDVVVGTGKALEQMETLRRVLVTSKEL